MEIMNAGVKNLIKTALIKKYIDDLGLTIPKLPTKPKFEIPPMPDLSQLMSDAVNMAQSQFNTDSLRDIYTDEYIKLMNEYNQAVEKAKALYNEKISSINDEEEKAIEKENANNPDPDNINGITRFDDFDKRKQEAQEEYNRAKKEALKKANASGVVKFKPIKGENLKKVKDASDKENKNKKDKAKALMSEAMKLSIVKQYDRYVRKELAVVNRLINESVQLYKDTKELFERSTKGIKDYYKSGGDGDKWVEDQCHQINLIFDNLKESLTEIGTDLTTMVAKIPIPEDIVTGTAVGVPNPGYKIMVFLENFKKLVTDITKVVNYVKQIIAIAKKMGFDIKKLQAFAAIMKLVEALKGNADKQFRTAVKQFTKRTKWSAEVQKMDEDKEFHLTKRAGYKYADAKVDYTNHTIELLGYKCYCTKNKEFVEGYQKNGGSYTDEKGKNYYYLKEDDVLFTNEDYDELDLDELSDLGETVGAAMYDYDNNTTTLQLSDGRIVTIDYLAESGDYVKLNDGTNVHIL